MTIRSISSSDTPILRLFYQDDGSPVPGMPVMQSESDESESESNEFYVTSVESDGPDELASYDAKELDELYELDVSSDVADMAYMSDGSYEHHNVPDMLEESPNAYNFLTSN